VGHAGVARDCEHLPALEVLTAILGGGPDSRLSRTLRQRLGIAYHIRSGFAARRLGGAFVVETSVASEAAGAAIAGIRREIERICDELVPAAELEQAKRRVFGAELRSLQGLISAGRRLGPAALKDDSQYQERRAHAIAAVEPEPLRELARRYLRAERLLAVIVGPAAALQAQVTSNMAHAYQPVLLASIS
jgi:zinc protease